MIQFDEQIFQSGWNHQLVLSLKLFGRILLEKVVENICGMRNGFCWQYYPIWTLVEKVAIITPLKCILLKNDGWTTTFLLLEGNCSGDLLNCRSLFGMFVGMFPCFICFSSAIFSCRTRCFPKVLDCFYKQTSCWNNFQQAIMIEMCRCKSDFAVWIRWFWRVFPLGKPCSCSCGPRHAAVFWRSKDAETTEIGGVSCSRKSQHFPNSLTSFQLQSQTQISIMPRPALATCTLHKTKIAPEKWQQHVVRSLISRFVSTDQSGGHVDLIRFADKNTVAGLDRM